MRSLEIRVLAVGRRGSAHVTPAILGKQLLRDQAFQRGVTQLQIGGGGRSHEEHEKAYRRGRVTNHFALCSILDDECVSLKRLPAMPATQEKAQLMSASEIDRTLVRLAHEILERTRDLDKLVFIGVRRRGVPLAQRLSKKIESLERRTIPVGILDINLYRDDLSTVSHQPVVNATDIPFTVAAKDIILMDDVLYTGRTIRAALDALFDQGRAARVRLLVLIDRGHRELPIEARYIGRMVQTTAN